jgi:hypothetical protein
VDLLHTIFDEDTIAKILQVPISQHIGDDFVSWPHTRFGVYSVRLAYNLARSSQFMVDRNRNGNGLSSMFMDDTKSWKNLWTAKAPGKMKITLWRFAHNCLPCGSQLQHRGVPASELCIFCGQRETVEHALLFCHFANEVWREIRQRYMIRLGRSHFTSPRVWALDFLERGSDLELTTGMAYLGCAQQGP